MSRSFHDHNDAVTSVVPIQKFNNPDVMIQSGKTMHLYLALAIAITMLLFGIGFVFFVQLYLMNQCVFTT